jgi:N6-L-threonylcarbamoyladenine synthase
VRYRLAELQAERGKPELIDDICASFQRAAVEVLVKKTLRAAAECRTGLVTLSGGVSCNQALRVAMGEACGKAGLRLLTAAPRLCTDNAAMIAFAASLRFRAGFSSEVTQEIDPNLALA